MSIRAKSICSVNNARPSILKYSEGNCTVEGDEVGFGYSDGCSVDPLGFSVLVEIFAVGSKFLKKPGRIDPSSQSLP